MAPSGHGNLQFQILAEIEMMCVGLKMVNSVHIILPCFFLINHIKFKDMIIKYKTAFPIEYNRLMLCFDVHFDRIDWIPRERLR